MTFDFQLSTTKILRQCFAFVCSVVFPFGDAECILPLNVVSFVKTNRNRFLNKKTYRSSFWTNAIDTFVSYWIFVASCCLVLLSIQLQYNRDGIQKLHFILSDLPTETMHDKALQASVVSQHASCYRDMVARQVWQECAALVHSLFEDSAQRWFATCVMLQFEVSATAKWRTEFGKTVFIACRILPRRGHNKLYPPLTCHIVSPAQSQQTKTRLRLSFYMLELVFFLVSSTHVGVYRSYFAKHAAAF
jgi:hypothetical protein